MKLAILLLILLVTGCSVDYIEQPVISDCQYMYDFEQEHNIKYIEVVVALWMFNDKDLAEPLPWGNRMDYEDFAEYSRCH